MNFKFGLLILLTIWEFSNSGMVVNTWNFLDAASKALEFLKNNQPAVATLEAGCSRCEELQCDHTVGFGGSPDENGETTLDAMIFDGASMDMGAVGGLRNIKNAISVAKYVLEHTKHSFLVGSLATEFAEEMGFESTSLFSNFSLEAHQTWEENNCQPNFWINVEPDNTKSCGPYHPLSENSVGYTKQHHKRKPFSDESNHDTIGMIVIDGENNIAAGTSTNGLRNKIPGRVGDSPIPGAGAYADNDVGAAVGTGDGDVMMRFLPSFLAVEEMRRGSTPSVAARVAVLRIKEKYPDFSGAILAVNKNGEVGAACNGMDQFPYCYGDTKTGNVILQRIGCES